MNKIIFNNKKQLKYHNKLITKVINNNVQNMNNFLTPQLISMIYQSLNK
jgi:hypothetical protein